MRWNGKDFKWITLAERKYMGLQINPAIETILLDGINYQINTALEGKVNERVKEELNKAIEPIIEKARNEIDEIVANALKDVAISSISLAQMPQYMDTIEAIFNFKGVDAKSEKQTLDTGKGI